MVKAAELSKQRRQEAQARRNKEKEDEERKAEEDKRVASIGATLEAGMRSQERRRK